MIKAITDLHVNDAFIAKFILLTGGKALPGVGKNKRTIIPVLEDLFIGRVCRPTSITWGRKYNSGYDFDEQIKSMLNDLNLPYETGNDAPRGGKNGNWIKLKNW